jgi:Tfp pilus assembly protein PilP
MRLAKAIANLMAVLAISLCLLPGAWAQSTAVKRAKRARRTAARAAAKQAVPKPAAPKPAAATPAAQAPALPPTPSEESVDLGKSIDMAGKRDPFVPLVTDKKDTGAEHLPPGKAGIVIASVRVDGTVKSGNGMIAVVSNPDQRVYFIREGDQLYDGDVEKISLDGVTFKENSKDAFGHPVERIVTKRIYASAGEQQ